MLFSGRAGQGTFPVSIRGRISMIVDPTTRGKGIPAQTMYVRKIFHFIHVNDTVDRHSSSAGLPAAQSSPIMGICIPLTEDALFFRKLAVFNPNLHWSSNSLGDSHDANDKV